MDTATPQEIAAALVASDFPECCAALLAGSVVRQQATPTSDLDIVVVRPQGEVFRASRIHSDWPVELFVHTPHSLESFWAQDMARRRPSLVQMCAEGQILTHPKTVAEQIQQRAKDLLAQGPPALSPEEREQWRYQLTDLRDDLIGAQDRREMLAIAPLVIEKSVALWLAHHRHWLGQGKWLHRALQAPFPEQAQTLFAAQEAIFQHNHKAPLLAWANEALDVAGGPLFAGYLSVAPSPPLDQQHR
jgi:hypothetical protein